MSMLGFLANLVVAQQVAAPDPVDTHKEEDVLVAYLFEPKQNISAWELAEILKHTTMNDGQNLGEIDFLSDYPPLKFFAEECGAPEIARHFRLKSTAD